MNSEKSPKSNFILKKRNEKLEEEKQYNLIKTMIEDKPSFSLNLTLKANLRKYEYRKTNKQTKFKYADLFMQTFLS